MTVLEVIQKSTEFLRKRSVANPRLNAEHLLAHVLGVGRMQLYLEFERALGEPELGVLRALVVRRGEGEPLQHLLGSVEFHGRNFLCDPRALVPRPETERLVEKILERLRAQNAAPARLADVGTGSGVIALTLALELPEAEVWASDISEDALGLARENAERLGATGRVRMARGHLLDPIEGTLDLVAANLPYVAQEEMDHLPPEVRRDPRAALDGGPDGLLLIGELVRSAPARLSPGGWLALEVGLHQAQDVRRMMLERGWESIEVEKDYQGIDRFVFARHG
jgi:release factor glutamine methyltransferase